MGGKGGGEGGGKGGELKDGEWRCESEFIPISFVELRFGQALVAITLITRSATHATNASWGKEKGLRQEVATLKVSSKPLDHNC